MPYFIGLMGGRYGWVPNPEEFPEDVSQKFKWLPGMSVTALELFNGALWDRNPNVRFLSDFEF